MILGPKDAFASETDYDVCIVGAGPAGIVLALELEKCGINTVLLESGLEKFSLDYQMLSDAMIVDEGRHASMRDAVRRQFGGMSAGWGGRCVPLNPVDFEPRGHVPSDGWPMKFSELEKYYQEACAYAECGEADFSSETALRETQTECPAAISNADIVSTTLERFSPPVNFGKRYWGHLEASKKITVILGVTCTKLEFSDARNVVSAAEVRSLFARKTFSVRAKSFVVACGGLETTRLLLNSDEIHKGGVGNHGGQLGKYYMGHISGKIAHVVFAATPDKATYEFGKDGTGVYCRKRFTISKSAQDRERILNSAFTLDNIQIYDPRHGNGILSAAYLALSTPLLRRCLAPASIVRLATGNTQYSRFMSHMKNVALSIPYVVAYVIPFLFRRYFEHRKLPGFFVRSKGDVYALFYRCEHAPSETSRVYLDIKKDAVGMRRLVVDFRYGEKDVASVLRAHELLDAYFRKTKIGRLVYTVEDLKSAVALQATDGHHQIGTTRMSRSPEHGVVDLDCKVHHVDNLFVASSSVFPTSGEANPTLTILALCIRLGEHLSRSLRVGSSRF